MLIGKSGDTTFFDIFVLSFSATILILSIVLFVIINKRIQIYHYKIMYILLDIPRKYILVLNS